MTTHAELDERYGRAQSALRRRVRWIVVGVVAAVIVVVASILTITSTLDTVRADGVSMEVIDEKSVIVGFEVSGPTGREIACAIEALDAEFGVVGWRVVVLPESDQHTRAFREQVPTLALATTGLVNSCWVV